MIKYIFRPFFHLNLFLCIIEVCTCIYISLYRNQLTFTNLCIGNMLWYITEYFYHRFLQHGRLYFTHKNHHIYPMKLKFIHLSFIITQGLCPMLIYLFFNRLAIFAMFLLNGILFEFCHLFSHFKLDTTIKRQFKTAKEYHKMHHLDENVNFGFLSPSYDYIFNTLAHDIDTSYIYI